MSADHARHRSLVSALRAARLLASTPLTLSQLADRLGCCPRTARRIVYALQAAGIDVDVRNGPDGPARRYVLDERAWRGVLLLPAD